jgi:guanine deaminase
MTCAAQAPQAASTPAANISSQEATIDQAFLGRALHAPERGAIEALTDALIVVDAAGVITTMLDAGSDEGRAVAAHFRDAGRLTELAAGQVLIPGLVDLHVHAPQWPQLGMRLDLPLEQWLQRYTFPLEARYADLKFAAEVYPVLVDALLAQGTTTAVYYATIHVEASVLLAQTCLAKGQRALVGRVAMDHPAECPDWYRDASAEAGVADTRRFIEAVQALPGAETGLVRPAITPRFIPACTDALLEGLGRLATETGCHVQTHVSESDWEHDHVLARCGASDAESLDAMGLLTRRSVLAHGVFLSGSDLDLLAARGAGVAHCPLSNVYFSDAVLPLRKVFAHEVNVGLGTDISGGANASMLNSARHAVIASRLLESGVDPELSRHDRRREGARITVAEAFWLATAGGGIVLDTAIGLFKPGYAFDALVIDPSRDLTTEPSDTPEELLEKLIYLGGQANIASVWVAGRRVSGAA